MRRGFSLVELSIVLVILGLLVGGILAGRSLIRASELRSIGSEHHRYKTAVMAFRDRYFALPGDMNNATKFWGIAAGTGQDSTCRAFASTTTATCNGDGDGIVGAYNGGTIEDNEIFRFWQHLANAGLIEGTYTGAAGAGASNHAVIGTNVPPAKFPAGGWSTYNYNPNGGPTVFQMEYGNTLIFGGPTADTLTHEKILRPEEAWNLDSKLDDGMPAYGRVIVRHFGDCTVANTGTNTKQNHDVSYRLNDATIQCMLIFRKQF